MKIILASQSPRRREILELMALPFEVIESHVKEIPPEGATPEELVRALAEQKARAVFALHPQDCVIGADTVVDLDGRVLGKPHTPERAREYLHLLQGRSHIVYTGICVLTPGHADIRSARTDVTFRPMSDEEIDWYVNTGDPLDKAGSYGIQGPAAPTLYEMLLSAHVIDQQHRVL